MVLIAPSPALRQNGDRVRGAGFQFGSVAQWLEQTTHNRSVAGSNPATPTITN